MARAGAITPGPRALAVLASAQRRAPRSCALPGSSFEHRGRAHRRARARGALARGARPGRGGARARRGQGPAVSRAAAGRVVLGADQTLARRRALHQGATIDAGARQLRCACAGATHELHSASPWRGTARSSPTACSTARLTMRDFVRRRPRRLSRPGRRRDPRQRRLLPARRARRDPVLAPSRATSSPSSACRCCTLLAALRARAADRRADR